MDGLLSNQISPKYLPSLFVPILPVYFLSLPPLFQVFCFLITKRNLYNVSLAASYFNEITDLLKQISVYCLQNYLNTTLNTCIQALSLHSNVKHKPGTLYENAVSAYLSTLGPFGAI